MSKNSLLEAKRSFRSLFDRVEALFLEAEKALSKEDFERATYFFQAAHSKDPENPRLYYKEAKLWHKFSLVFPIKSYFIQGYKAYKIGFNHPFLKNASLLGALSLKIDEVKAFNSKNAIQTAEYLLSKIEKHLDDFSQEEVLSLKAELVFQKAKLYQDPFELNQAIAFFHQANLQEKNPVYLKNIACCHMEAFKLSIHLEHIFKAIQYIQEALDIDSLQYDLYLHLAKCHQLLFDILKEDGCIEKFHETLDLASLLDTEKNSLEFFHAKGLIEMGIEADHPKFVKIGMDKCNLCLINQYQPIDAQLLIARALAYLGNKKEQFFLIQQGFDKIKSFEDDPQNPDLAQALYEILLCYGRYFGELDYFYQAIERIQELMSYQPPSRHNWHLLAKAYYEVSFLDNNPQTGELALYFITKALSYFECPRLLLQKGMILSRLGELKQQSELFHTALEVFESGLSKIQLLYQPTSKELFEYAKLLDLVGNFHEDEQYYVRSLETLSHLLLTDPGYKDIHHQIALTQFHYGELSGNTEIIKKSLSHFKLALINPDNDAIYTDWAIACITLSEMAESAHEVIFFQAEASAKLKKALKNGALQAYYFMACLCSINHMHEQAIKLLKLAEKHECLPSAEDLLQDDWLSNIRLDSEFIKLVERQEMKRL